MNIECDQQVTQEDSKQSLERAAKALGLSTSETVQRISGLPSSTLAVLLRPPAP